MKKHALFLTAIILCFSFLICTPRCEAALAYTPADSVWTNGHIYTLDDQFSIVEAIAVKDGRIIFAGDTNGAQHHVGGRTAVVDLKGASILPGLNDSHMHFLGLGQTKIQVASHWKPKEEILRSVKEAAEKARSGEWILGRGWNQMVWSPATFPTRQELDAVAPDVPVALTRTCGHAMWVNSKALELAGIDKNTPDPVGGEFMRDANGMPTGVMTDQAMRSVRDIIPAFTDEQNMDALRAAQRELFQFGITSATDAGSSVETITFMKQLYEKGDLKVRLNVMGRAPGNLQPKEQLVEAKKYFDRGIETGLFGDRLQIRGYKLMSDGSLGARSAWMLEDYSDRSGHKGNGMFSDEELYQLVKMGYEAGFQVNTHAIGDAANRQVLDAFARVLKENPRPDHRLRVEHAQILTADDLTRFVELGALPVMQTVHATSDMNMAEDRVGPERIRYAYAWRKLLNTGAIIPNGTDAPVESADPWENLYAAVTRMDAHFNPIGGWYPEEKMTRVEALRSLTVWPAYASFEEDKKGRIMPGMLADFIVIDRDYMECRISEIREIKVRMTVVGGEIVYQR